jgi:hypothetical protein
VSTSKDSAVYMIVLSICMSLPSMHSHSMCNVEPALQTACDKVTVDLVCSVQQPACLTGLRCVTVMQVPAVWGQGYG